MRWTYSFGVRHHLQCAGPRRKAKKQQEVWAGGRAGSRWVNDEGGIGRLLLGKYTFIIMATHSQSEMKFKTCLMSPGWEYSS